MMRLKRISWCPALRYILLSLLACALWYLSLRLYVQMSGRGTSLFVRDPHSLTCRSIVSGNIDVQVREHPEVPVCIEVQLKDVRVGSDGTITMCRRRVLVVDIGSIGMVRMRDRLRMAHRIESQEEVVVCGDFSLGTTSPSYLIDGELFGQYMFFPIWFRPVRPWKEDILTR